jgi:hypothetical protein
MRIRPRAIAVMASVAFLTSCAAGPHQVRRSLDDLDQKIYVNSPWWSAALWVIPVIPVGMAGSFVLDFLITDPWAFWFDDAWDGNGTGFEHAKVEWVDGRMGSLLLDRSGWTRIEK